MLVHTEDPWKESDDMGQEGWTSLGRSQRPGSSFLPTRDQPLTEACGSVLRHELRLFGGEYLNTHLW